MALQWSSRSPSVLSMKSLSLHWIGHSSCGALFFYTTSLSCQERRKLLLPCHFISFLPGISPWPHSALMKLHDDSRWPLSGIDWCFRWSLLFSQVYSQGLRNDPPHLVPWCATLQLLLQANQTKVDTSVSISISCTALCSFSCCLAVVWMVVTPVFILAWDDWTEDTWPFEELLKLCQPICVWIPRYRTQKHDSKHSGLGKKAISTLLTKNRLDLCQARLSQVLVMESKS